MYTMCDSCVDIIRNNVTLFNINVVHAYSANIGQKDLKNSSGKANSSVFR